jgi:hypothetical protein
VISQSSLRNFRTTILDQDDVFQSKFLTNVIFYGSKREDLHLDPSTFQELFDWETEKHIFIENASAATVASGPYVLASGKSWQPWRIYIDFNATFMCTFKPSEDFSGRYVFPVTIQEYIG